MDKAGHASTTKQRKRTNLSYQLNDLRNKTKYCCLCNPTHAMWAEQEKGANQQAKNETEIEHNNDTCDLERRGKSICVEGACKGTVEPCYYPSPKRRKENEGRSQQSDKEQTDAESILPSTEAEANAIKRLGCENIEGIIEEATQCPRPRSSNSQSTNAKKNRKQS